MSTEQSASYKDDPLPHHICLDVTFECPFCKSNYVVGAYKSAYGVWPDGWHLACATCNSRWFLAFKKRPETTVDQQPSDKG